jgi:hypothetical protein
MNNTTSKKADRVSTLHPPLQDLVRAAQPERLNREEFTRGTAKLQEKMKVAAKEFANLEHSNRGWIYEPEYRDQPFELLVAERFLPYVHCTPEIILFRLGNEWIKLTEQNLGESLGSEENAKWWLTELHKAAKKYGKVSWALPKLRKGGLA